MSRYSILHAIEQLDPEKDHRRIVFLSTCYDFPFDTTRAFGVFPLSYLLCPEHIVLFC